MRIVPGIAIALMLGASQVDAGMLDNLNGFFGTGNPIACDAADAGCAHVIENDLQLCLTWIKRRRRKPRYGPGRQAGVPDQRSSRTSTWPFSTFTGNFATGS